MSAYYQFIERRSHIDGSVDAYYQPTSHAQGAWNEHEQHMAPATGIMAHELIGFMPKDNMRVARVSLDILGMIPLTDFTISTRCIRPGRTIELIEAVMRSEGRDCIIARAWRLLTQDTQEIAGLEDTPAAHSPEILQGWGGMKSWPGGFIQTLDFVADSARRAGRGMVWMTNKMEMVAGTSTPDVVRLLGMVDVANGIVPRLEQDVAELEWMFPNTDLQIHMHRLPKGKWLGIDAVQQYGADGIGLTSAILHDLHGPFGRSEQILTIRPMPR